MDDAPKYDDNVSKLLRSIPVPLTLGENEFTTIGYYCGLAANRIEELESQLQAMAEYTWMLLCIPPVLSSLLSKFCLDAR